MNFIHMHVLSGSHTYIIEPSFARFMEFLSTGQVVLIVYL
jgi:hypothetical protein